MSYVEMTICVTWKQNVDGFYVPVAISDIYAWAIANDQYLPEGRSGFGPFGKYEEINDNITAKVKCAFIAKLTVTVATAQHFASDNRIWTLGYKRFDDEGNQTSSNWNTTLTAKEITQALNYLEAHGYDRQVVASKFSASDTRQEIARKLKAFFKE